MKKHYEPGTSLNKFGDENLEPIWIKGQDSTFGLGFRTTRKDFQAMISQKREKR